MPMNEVFDRIESGKEDAIQMLVKLASQPSVAAKGEGIRECAKLVEGILEDLGAAPKAYDIGEGSPVVTGEIKSKRNPRKTVLFYNHYDVQPPEPLELWDTPPFVPTVRDGKMYGRGVADDKGELTGRVSLTKAFLESRGDLPCNFKFLFEGEEEIGSVHLHEYVKKYPQIFKADSVIWEFGGVDPKDRPNVILGVKGIFYVELTATHAKRDAHSSLGAVVDNPAWRLVGALNTIKQGDKILVPGWYDNMRRLTKEELQLIKSQPYEADAVKKDLGITRFIGGIGVEEVKKALVNKPTCTICGLHSGYTGKGSKTVLPSEAFAKIDFRLVPDQDPDDLHRKLTRHLARHGYRDVKVTYAEGEKAKRTSHKAPVAVAAREAAQAVYGTKPVVTVSSPGTGPMYLFEAPCVAIGGGSPFSHAHAPNENLRLDLFVKGMKWVADTVERFAAS
ncbi:MAG: M20/M25/M40 family metallo-hydrolase [Nitrososphaerales archaeon]|nr:M20/M25/M40 family metallo-hydrolase [Nitrososphaerales archaeon]